MRNELTLWLDRVDPGTHRRIKGVRLVTAYGVAAMLGAMPDIDADLPDRAMLPFLAGGLSKSGSTTC